MAGAEEAVSAALGHDDVDGDSLIGSAVVEEQERVDGMMMMGVVMLRTRKKTKDCGR